MKSRYKLLVRGVGDYSEDSLWRLNWVVFKHRLEHLLKGEGFRD
jgi:hypothetical protein